MALVGLGSLVGEDIVDYRVADLAVGHEAIELEGKVSGLVEGDIVSLLDGHCSNLAET